MRVATGVARYALWCTAFVPMFGCAPEVSMNGPECSSIDSVEDCPSGSICIDFGCRELCAKSSECPEPYEACLVDDEPPGYCFPYSAACSANADCHEGFYCASHVCQKLPANADCDNGVADGDETGTDCGGVYCRPCPAGSGCETGADCSSSICSVDGVCQEPPCEDGEQNGEETDIDCGGVCLPCEDGSRCRDDEDCLSRVCMDDHCQAPSCSDHVANGLEADIDCGRPESGCSGCEVGADCAIAVDCQSGVCGAGGCVAAACTDQTQNGSETDVDCGGACPACADGDRCTSGDDCASGACGAWRCLTPGRVLGTAYLETFESAAITAEGNILVVGRYTDPIDYGTGELPCNLDPFFGSCMSTAVVVLFSPKGNAIWATPLLAGQHAIVTAVRILRGGDIAIAGTTAGWALGGQILSGRPLIGRLGNDGDATWLRMASSGAGFVTSLAANDAGKLAIGGWFQGTLDFGSDTQISSLGNNDAFVAVYSDDGSLEWAAGYGDIADQSVESIDPMDGDFVVAGGYWKGIDFGRGAHASAGARDIFVARVTDSGAEVWSKVYGGSEHDAAHAVAVASDGSVYVTGQTASTIDFGNGPLDGNGSRDAFVLHLTEDGALNDAQRFGSTDFLGTAITEHADGNILIAGWFQHHIHLGSTSLESRGGSDGYVALLSPGLEVVSAHQIGGTGQDRIHGMAAAEGGAVVAVGSFRGTADLGWGPVDSSGDGNNDDAFLVTLSP